MLGVDKKKTKWEERLGSTSIPVDMNLVEDKNLNFMDCFIISLLKFNPNIKTIYLAEILGKSKSYTYRRLKYLQSIGYPVMIERSGSLPLITQIKSWIPNLHPSRLKNLIEIFGDEKIFEIARHVYLSAPKNPTVQFNKKIKSLVIESAKNKDKFRRLHEVSFKSDTLAEGDIGSIQSHQTFCNQCIIEGDIFLSSLTNEEKNNMYKGYFDRLNDFMKKRIGDVSSVGDRPSFRMWVGEMKVRGYSYEQMIDGDISVDG